jgi:hypothetical protein
MFRSRRSVAPPPETAKVAEVVQAYYDAGKRPASHFTPAPPSIDDMVVNEAPSVAPEAQLVSEPEPAPVAVAEAPSIAFAEQAAPVHKTLVELAEELEAFIEVIRYGDDLGSNTARN